MTHPNHQTNGASLEDCHTNFFALTDLCGIKWRKLVWSEGGGGSNPASAAADPLDDPVLRSYSQCIANDILCVWRRTSAAHAASNPYDLGMLAPPPPSQVHPPLSLAAAKELWIFWYGEEPDLSELVAPELISPDGEQGSWESGLSYECRSLLFKALHNLIERCLLSRDFVRLGKWFVQPYDGPKKNMGASTTHLSFSFAFFVHGESTVCASVDVRQHPPVRRLTKSHLLQAQSSTNGLQVILAPFSLSGNLTGQGFKTPDAASRILEDWGHFYPVEKFSVLDGDYPGVPPAVEVIVGGVKMRYPSCYVLVTDMDENVNAPPAGMLTVITGNQKPPGNLDCTGPPAGIQTPPPSPVAINSKVPQSGLLTVSVEHTASMQRPATASTIMPERVWQECVQGGPPSTGQSHDGQWDFVDPTKRTSCSCSKCRKYLGPSKSCSSKGGISSKPGKGARGRVPFHRRSPVPLSDDRYQQQGSCTPQGGPPSYPRTQESLTVPSVGSPPSAAPSPLPNPHSQPASIPPGEQTMPTLSPQPTAQPSTPADKPENTPGEPPKSAGSPTSPQPPASSSGAEQGNADQRNIDDKNVITLPVQTLKRPVLTSKEYENAVLEEEQTLDLLYDYSTLDAWLNHPVKKFKPDSKENKIQKMGRFGDIYSLYGNTPNGVQTPNDITNLNGNTQQCFIKQEIKQEPGTNYMMENDSCITSTPISGGMKRPGDPYEFEEEGANSVNMDGFKRGVPIKEEAKEIKKCPAGNLFTSEGLQPSYKDLDQIFDNSDDTSSDEALQVQTPPGSNTSMGPNEDSRRMSSGHSGGGTSNSILRQEELSKMFPTPPSLEHNPIASPCGQLDVPPSDMMCDFGIVRIKQESYPNLGSPEEEKIEDWSFVFKPPLICKMVGSSKYAPLTNLPSQHLPPIVLPTHCVYKPSWVTHSEKPAREIQHPVAPNGLSSRPGSVASNPHNPHSVPFPPSPLHTAFRPPPPPYELSSPATSTASSYLNKNLNSVEPVATPSVVRAPEASSLLVNILLADTALNIFRDHNFDSCTLCVCNAGPKVVGNIRGADAGIYLTSMQPAIQPTQSAAPSSPFLAMGLGGPSSSYGMLSPPHHQQMLPSEEDPIRCSCGFSAVVNRKLSHRSGLFYEDELEITGIAEDPSERKKGSLFEYLLKTSTTKIDPSIERDQVDTIPQTVLELVREQCVMLQSTSNSLHRASQYYRSHSNPPYSTTVNVLEFTDSNEVTSVALEQSRQANMDSAALTMCKIEELQHRNHGKTANALCIHKWPFLRASGPQCNQDIVRVMKSLQPLLQEAIQKKCTTRLWEAPYTVKGPLTWRQFHRLAGRGTDDRCEPQPIPSLIVGHDKDWLSLSPYALQHWDRLLLEPYSFARDVAYIVVAPDNDAILPRVRTFFKELSTAYEVCRLGRHSPITKVLRDGILRVGKNAKTKLANEPVEDWFTMLGESDTTDMIKLYAQACKHHLAPHLLQVPMDKTLLDPPETTDKPAIERPTPSPMPPPNTPDNSQNSTDKAPSTPKNDQDGGDSRDQLPTISTLSESTLDDDDQIAPSIVVYLVEPFTMGTDHADLQRLACVALLRCFQSVLNAVPDHIRTNISVQIISQESITELGRARDRNRQSDHMRALALSIFSQCRRLLVHSSNVKSLTGFGTAAMADLFLKNKDEKNRAPYKLYTPPYVLASLKERVESAESFGQSSSEQCSVLYVSYCLSEDQSLILAVATDERGEICESVTINIDVPNRSRRKKASARRIGLQKLMDFILGVMSQTVQPWRLVVGRIGRIGHGELKGWSWLLSRKCLLKSSKHLKEICRQCELMYPTNVPCIMSACLVSLEPDSTLRLMPDQFTPDERFSQASVNSQLSTPHDVTCTHILVFPTSATTQSSQTAFQETHINGPDLGDDELLTALRDDMPDGIDGMNDFNDIFNVWPESGPGGGPSPIGSPRREESRPGSPGCGMGGNGRQSPFPCGANGSRSGEIAEEVGTLLQQPLALGYLVSTAPTGRMPRWFWASCPHLEGVCPAFLKNALHLHSPAIQQSSDDLLQQAAVTSHPLDSQYTTDVLRFVLEGYNALSWLALDSNTQDRLSCLPVHIQVLTQLYHMTATLL